MGFIQKLTAAKLLIGLKNKKEISKNFSSQFFHLDDADLSFQHLKLFVNINKVNEKNGAFTFLDTIQSSRLASETSYGSQESNYRLEEDIVINSEPKKNWHSALRIPKIEP